MSDLLGTLAHTSSPDAYPAFLRRFRSSRSVRAAISIAALGIALVLLILNYDLSKVGHDLSALRPLILTVVLTAMLSNVLIAVVRFKFIASDMGDAISWRRAMATVSAGSLAGALFFQLAGQLIARSTILGRIGVPFANVVVITLYERAVAAVLSGLLAVAGAYFVFGRIYVDPTTGGADLIRLVIGLIAATAVGALLGYGRNALKAVLPLLSERVGFSLLCVFGLTFLVQLPIMIAYVTIAHALSPDVSLLDLIAATAIVMFAASVPISLAGWGIREMGAVTALGFIGVSGHAAFSTAIIIGIGSLMSMAAVAAISLPGPKHENSVRQPDTSLAPAIDYTMALSWGFPLAAATFVLFQVYVPVGSGLLNVNLADPIALIAAALFIVVIWKTDRRPIWRISYLNVAVALATGILTISLLIGFWSFGYTTWAWVNRYLGWFVLLAYGATGALIATQGGVEGRRTILLTYVGATIAVAAVDFCTAAVRLLGINIANKINGKAWHDLEAFSQNHNFFAFQLLMALSAIFVTAKGKYLRIALISIALTALWFAGSRSGWIALFCIVVLALYLKTVGFREIAIALAITVVAGCFPFLGQVLKFDRTVITANQVRTSSPLITSSQVIRSSQAASSDQLITSSELTPEIVPNPFSTRERLFSMVEGWKLFETAPLFGAGLGAFRNLGFEGSTRGIPLLIHSTAIWLLAELGMVGFLIFAVSFARVFLQELKRSTQDSSALAVLCLLAFAVMSIPADMVYQRTFWLLMGAALAFIPEPAMLTEDT